MTDAEPVPSTTQSQETAGKVSEGKKGSEAQAAFNSTTTVSNVGDLQQKSPEMYKAMQEGIALRIIGEQRKHNERMKQINREAQRQNRG